VLDEWVRSELQSIVGVIGSVEPVGGGCIAHASRISSEGDRFFLKWANGAAGSTFEAEAAGLKALRRAGSRLLIPDVLTSRNADSLHPGFILMEWVDPGPKREDSWHQLGLGLAEVHRHVQTRFGWTRDNFIGRIQQSNLESENWVDFFRRQRLEFQRGLARELGRWNRSWEPHFDRLCRRLGELIPSHPESSLVHGDLWSGNVLPASGGRASLIDPAVYFGHREVDLGMSELFGGFPDSFYRTYGEAWPLEPGYSDRKDIYNLYHLINHLNHFGQGYAGQVDRVLRRF
jgi:fructosamine-3-kinase